MMDKYLVRSSSTESLSNKRPAEDNIWRKPKRTAHPSRVTSQVSFTSDNRFKDLADDAGSDSSSAVHAAPGRPIKPGRIPPIVVKVKDDWTHQTITTLIQKYSQTFHLQYRFNGKVAIHCHSNDSHRLVSAGLRAENVQFHTFSRKEERKYKVVVRGVPSDTVPLVCEELAEMGFHDASVTKLKTSSPEDKITCPPLLVQLPAGADIVKFKQTKYICNCVIKIERFKPKTAAGTQCYRCQLFGHASKNCNMPERCVKCVGQHASKECPKKERTSPAQCCNCEGSHPSNYRQCPVRLNYLKRTQKKKVDLNTKPNPAITTKPSNNIGPTPTFPVQTVPKHPRPLQNSTKPNGPTCDESLVIEAPRLDGATEEILQIMNVIKRIKQDFISCNTMLDKVILVLTHLGKYV